MSVTVTLLGKKLALRAPYSPVIARKCQRFPDGRRWNQRAKAWSVDPTRANVAHLLAEFPDARWAPDAQAVRDRITSVENEIARRASYKEAVLTGHVEAPTDYVFSTTPFDQQLKAFLLSRNAETFALLMEQGTGKTKVVVDTASWLYLRRELDAVLVICPNSVKSTWEEEIDFHLAGDIDSCEVATYRSGDVTMKGEGITRVRPDLARVVDSDRLCRRALLWLIMNVDAFSRPKGEAVARRFLEGRRGMIVVDESSKIKSQSAQRTKSIIKVGQLAERRRILTGTPVTQGPLDLFAQFKFLDPEILGFGSFYAFRNHFAIVQETPWGKQVVGYRPGALEELHALIDPFSFRVTKDECLDLPPKLHATRVTELSKRQRALYAQMKDQMIAEIAEGAIVSVSIVLTQIMRLQQIVGGFLPEPNDAGRQYGDRRVTPIEAPKNNEKVQALLDIAEEAAGKIVVWARFRPEIAMIAAELRRQFGDESVVEFHGGVPEEDRTKARHAFQDDASPVRFFVGNQATGSHGLTLTAARTVVYYSNTFSYDERIQSEDRVHRIGLSKSVEYIDLIAKGTVDTKIRKVLRDKRSYADVVTGDIALNSWKEWL